jgi:hypothetical protein
MERVLRGIVSFAIKELKPNLGRIAEPNGMITSLIMSVSCMRRVMILLDGVKEIILLKKKKKKNNKKKNKKKTKKKNKK